MEKISEKIQKLLSLATSSNENEAKLAAQKANELMIKYNLQMSDLREEADYDIFVVEEGVRMPVELKFIGGILVKHFFVELIKGRGCLRMIAEKQNLENGRYLYDFLTRTFKECWANYKKETKCDNSLKQTYYLGLYRGLDEKLSATRKKVESEYGLVVVKDEKLQDFISEQFGKTRSEGRTSVQNRDENAYSSGKADGANITIRKGISSSSESGRYLK